MTSVKKTENKYANLSRRQKLNNGGRNAEMEVHSEGERDQKGTQKTTWSTNRDTVSARTRCGEPSNHRVGPRGPITKAAHRRNITRKQNTKEIHHLKCYVINADSLPNKLTELRTRLEHDVNPDIIVISEVKPKNHRYPMTEADFKLDGYDTFKCNIDNRVGRGMIIYTKPDLDASQITSTSEFSEHLIIRIPLRGKDELIYYTLVN